MTKLVQATVPVEEAEIQERSVSVKVLTIGTKQVTQTMYKQLVEEKVIDKNYRLKGHVWGWVNLHSDCKNEKHIHCIWEYNGKLRKDYVTRVCPIEIYHNMKWWIEQLGRVYLCKRVSEDNDFMSQVEITNLNPVTCSTSLYVSGQKLNPQVSAYTSDSGLRFATKKIIDETWWGGQNFDFSSHISIYNEIEKLAIEVTDIENKWIKSYKAIEEAGQLFIAVSVVWK